MRRFICAALIVMAAFALPACGSTTPQPSPSASFSTGVYGIVLTNRGGLIISPSPVALPGGFGVVNDLYPYRRAPVVIKRRGADGSLDVVVRLRADARGIFACALPPGRYVVECPVPSAGSQRVVVVRRGRVSRVKVPGAIKY